jgi:hypothetical protein
MHLGHWGDAGASNPSGSCQGHRSAWFVDNFVYLPVSMLPRSTVERYVRLLHALIQTPYLFFIPAHVVVARGRIFLPSQEFAIDTVKYTLIY